MADDEAKQGGEAKAAGDKASRKGPGLSMKVSQKGALSVYGLGRFPVTLYKEQWLKLLETSEEIRTFLRSNDAQLKVKGAATESDGKAAPGETSTPE